MSYRSDKLSTFEGLDSNSKTSYVDNISSDEIHDLFLEVLYNGVHGFCFSLYEEGQKPGDAISEDQIRRRLDILKPYTKWIRSFSCTKGNELIPMIAKEYGLKTVVGAWLGSDEEKNKVEIANLIQLAQEGHVDVAAVGNEVLYRNDLTEAQLLKYITTVKEQLPDHIPVGYVDAYYEFIKRPNITTACDIILCNCYPFWEGTDINFAFQHMQQMYHQVVQSAPGKKVLITETGWPSQGQGLGSAIPTHQNALKYFINTQLWSHDEEIEIFYFSSFDESWKVGDEGDVGAFWGIWDSKGKLKF